MLDKLARMSSNAVIALVPLSLPPVGYTAGWQAGELEIALRALLARFLSDALALGRVRIASENRLARVSPPAERLDVRGEMATGFPYRLPHASALAGVLAQLMRGATPKKGLITDLDDTMWRGIVGDAGVDGVHWDLDGKGQIHGLYQQLLRSLADAGTLIGVASKNDPHVVDEVFARGDCVLTRDRIFPLDVHWHAKSRSVARILAAWNIAADSVMFVDDSPLELAEVAAAHPEVECILFPRYDEEAAYELFDRLRDLFGKESIGEEDALRRESLRATYALCEGGLTADAPDETSVADDLLATLDAEIAFSLVKRADDKRAFELINK